MTTYQLKTGQPDIEIVDGPFAGRKYQAGEIYAEMPPGEEQRFEPSEKATVTPMPVKVKKVPSRIEDESA